MGGVTGKEGFQLKGRGEGGERVSILQSSKFGPFPGTRPRDKGLPDFPMRRYKDGLMLQRQFCSRSRQDKAGSHFIMDTLLA